MLIVYPSATADGTDLFQARRPDFKAKPHSSLIAISGLTFVARRAGK